MKKISLIISFLMMIVSSENSGAQSNYAAPFNNFDSGFNLKAKSPDKKKTKNSVASVNANVLNKFVRSNRITSEIKATKVNIKAVRNFSLIYKTITDVQWFRTEGGFLANFNSKGIDTKIVYDEKGRWLYNLLSYPEAFMAFEIRDMVKRRYYDNEILFVHQYVFDNNISVYLIRMKDQQSNISTLKVCDGEIVDITDRE